MSKNTKPRLFVPIETKVREFHGKLFFSLVAAERGYEVVLGGQQSLQRNLHLFDRGTYVDKSIAITRDKWFRRCRAMGNNVVSWDEEGLVYFDDQTYWELRLYENSLEQVDRFVVWGERLKETIVAKVPEASEKIFLGGNPRFDMLRPELRAFYQEPAEALNSKYGRIIQVNTSFSLANHFRGDQAVRKLMETYPIAQSRPKFLKGWIEAQARVFREFKKMLPVISWEFPDHTIIVRPHPSENHDVWREFSVAYKNVVVNSDGNVLEWIKASDVLVHFNCTTGIEAYLMDVPAIAYNAVEGIEEYEQALPNSLSYEVKNIEGLVEKIKDLEGQKFTFEKSEIQREIAGSFISGISGELASDRIVNDIYSCRIPGSAKRSLRQQFNVIQRRLWLAAKKIKESGRGDDVYDKQKYPGISLAEMKIAIEKLSSITGRFSHIHCKPVCRDCYVLST